MFITEWGLYRYTRGPMGVASSGDEFCKRTDQALAGIPGLFKLVDDILVQGHTKKELVKRVKAVFHRCLENQITLSSSKHQVGQNIKFASHVITDQGTKPDPDMVASIKDYPEPANLTDLQSFMGLANQFGGYSQTSGMPWSPSGCCSRRRTPIPGGKTTPRQ